MVEIYSAHQTQQMSSPVPIDCPLETLDDLGRFVELAFLNGYIDPHNVLPHDAPSADIQVPVVKFNINWNEGC